MQTAFLDAVNEMVGNSQEYLTRLKENLETAINMSNLLSAEALSAKATEFDETLVRKLLVQATVYKDYLKFQFKSDLTVSVEK